MRDELCIVHAIVLDDTRSLQQTSLIGLTLEIVTETTLDDTFQITRQLTHLSCSEEHIRRTVVIEEQRRIVEMAQTGVDGPGTLSLGSRKDIGVSHATCLVGSQQRPELTVVVFQRGSPLSTTIDRPFQQVILRRIRQLVEDIANGLPILQIFRGHDRRTRHQMHRSRHQIEGVAHTDNIRIRHIRPQHRVVDLRAVTLSR